MNLYQWLDDDALNLLREYFDKISEEIAERISRQQNVREDTLSDDFVDIINKSFGNLLPGLHFSISAKSNTSGVDEKKTGIDLGIILSSVFGHSYLNKAIFIQSKKSVYNSGRLHYPEIERKEGREMKGCKQAKSMLAISPSSFFFLFNSSEIIQSTHYNSLLKKHFNNTRRNSYYSQVADPPFDELFKSFPYFPLSPLSDSIIKREIWAKKGKSYIGILVSSAHAIATFSNSSVCLEDVLPFSITLSDFMLYYFLTCFVGDSRLSILRKAGWEEDDKKHSTITRKTIFMKFYFDRKQ